MSWRPPEPLPVLVPPVVRAARSGPVAGCFTANDAVTAWERLDYDWPPLVDLAARLVVHLGLELALPTERQPIPLAVWLVQRAALAYGAARTWAPPERARAFLDPLLENGQERLTGLRVVAEEGVWQPLMALPLPIFLDCRTVRSVGYASPETGEATAIRHWLLADLDPMLRQSWGLAP